VTSHFGFESLYYHRFQKGVFVAIRGGKWRTVVLTPSLPLGRLDVIRFSVYLNCLSALATRATRPAVSLSFITSATTQNVVESFRASAQRLRHDVVDGSVSSVLQRLIAVVAELLFSLREMSSAFVSVRHKG
jgi:hypothetical protein